MSQTIRVHPDRIAGGNCHHRNSDRVAPPRRSEGARKQPVRMKTLNTSSSAPCAAELPRRQPALPQRQGLINTPKTAGYDFSFFAMLLPYIEQGNLSSIIDPASATWAQYRVPIYQSPADPSSNNGAGRNGYGAGGIAVNFQIVGNPSAGFINAMFGTSPRLAASFPDGTSNTVFFATKSAVCGKGGSEWAVLGGPARPPPGVAGDGRPLGYVRPSRPGRGHLPGPAHQGGV